MRPCTFLFHNDTLSRYVCCLLPSLVCQMKGLAFNVLLFFFACCTCIVSLLTEISCSSASYLRALSYNPLHPPPVGLSGKTITQIHVVVLLLPGHRVSCSWSFHRCLLVYVIYNATVKACLMFHAFLTSCVMFYPVVCALQCLLMCWQCRKTVERC